VNDAPPAPHQGFPDAASSAPDLQTVRQIGDWLLRDGRFLPDNAAIFGELCEHIAAAGLPVDWATLHLRALHPRYRGVARVWRRGEPLEQRFMDHGIERTATYLESPVRAVAENHHRLEWRLDGYAPLPFAVLEELREQGYTHYVIDPVPYAAGPVSALSWATRRPGGSRPAAGSPKTAR